MAAKPYQASLRIWCSRGSRPFVRRTLLGRIPIRVMSRGVRDCDVLVPPTAWQSAAMARQQMLQHQPRTEERSNRPDSGED